MSNQSQNVQSKPLYGLIIIKPLLMVNCQAYRIKELSKSMPVSMTG